MADTESTEVSSHPPSPVHHSGLFGIRELQQRHPTLFQPSPQPRRTEISELLQRHYNDKSLIDEWTSWHYELSFLQKSSICASVIGIAGLAGAVVGLAFPLITLASGILYIASSLLNGHEQHRRDRGLRFAADTIDLTEQLDSMMDLFKRIAADMTAALEKVKVQASEMSEQNAEIGERTRDHKEEQEKLQHIITSISEQSDRAEKVQSEMVNLVENISSELVLVPSHINNTVRAIHDFQTSIISFSQTASQINHTEENLADISAGLKNCVERIAIPKPSSEELLDTELEDMLQQAQNAILMAKNRHAAPKNTDEARLYIMRQ